MSDKTGKHTGWGPEDYWRIGPVYVLKRLVLATVITLSVAVLLLFGLPFQTRGDTAGLVPSYRYDDPELAEWSGLVRVLDDGDCVRYVGEVASGAYTGRGQVFDKAGTLLYDGPLVDGVYEGANASVYHAGMLAYTGEMAGNLYEGQGRRIDPVTGIVSEGQFSRGFLDGQGREFYADGTLLRDGIFSRDLLEGEGREYSPKGVLLREGSFSEGLLHGEGREYTTSGKLCYEGQFWRGVYHGQGTLYDTLLGVRGAEGTFVYGKLTGPGSIYHPSGQLLYRGQVCGQRPRADAFLGLSLADVEEAFTEHWALYSCESVTAFVYPYFSLMFITESPVELVSPSQVEEASQRERQELLEALEDTANYAVAADTRLCPPPDYDDELLSPGTDKRAVIITQVLSYGQPLPCAAQPDFDAVSGQHLPGWREWFSDFAMGEATRGVSVRQSGPFVWRFTPCPGTEEVEYVEEFRAEYAGVETVTVQKEAKETRFWYQAAQRGEGT